MYKKFSTNGLQEYKQSLSSHSLGAAILATFLILPSAGYAQQVVERTYEKCSLGKRFSNGRLDYTQQTCLPAKTESCDQWAVDMNAPHGLNNASDTQQGPNGWGVETGLDNVDSLQGNCVTSSGTITDSNWFTRKRSCRTFTQKIIGKCVNKRVEQSSIKMVCGKRIAGSDIRPALAGGEYHTVVNIHNPTYQQQEMRWKVVSADDAKDGKKILGFVYAKIGPDASQYIDCSKVLDAAGNDLFDGFFVVEANTALDVSAVYTLSDSAENPISIDVEQSQERSLSIGESWSCEQNEDCKDKL
jgi:hypothetical protein